MRCVRAFHPLTLKGRCCFLLFFFHRPSLYRRAPTRSAIPSRTYRIRLLQSARYLRSAVDAAEAAEMATSWERYLWERNLVALDPLSESTTSLHLMDIVVQHGTERGLSGRPTLKRVGSMCELRSDMDQHQEWPATKERIQESLQELEGVNVKHNDLFDKDIPLDRYDCHSASGYGCLASIITAFKGALQADSYRGFIINEVVNESVKEKFLNEVLEKGRQVSAVWEPNVDLIRRDYPSGPHDTEKLELWLVTEIKRCKQLCLKHHAAKKAAVAADASGIIGMPISATLTANGTSTGDLAVTAQSPIVPFAFQAIRLIYNNDGKLIKRNVLDKGKRVPKKRAERNSEFDANNDPRYHMLGLFYQASEVEGTSSGAEGHEYKLECLRFVA